MEACMMKPEAKKKPKPRPNTAPPKPPEVEYQTQFFFSNYGPAEIQRYDPERPEKPAPVAPPRPTDAELGHTQHRVKRLAAVFDEQANGYVREQETPVVPPRPSEKEMNSTAVYSQHRRPEVEGTQKSAQANNPKDEADFKSSNQRGVTGIFQRSQKGKAPSFTTYLSPNTDKDNPDEVQVKQASSSKPGGLKGVMKGLQFKSTPKASRDQSPGPQTEEAAAEKEQPAEKNLLEKNAEPKQEKGGFFSGILKKPHKSSDGKSPRASRDPSPESRVEEGGAEKEQSAEKNKQERNAETKQDKGGLLAGMFRKTPKDKSLSTAASISKADSDSEDTDDEEKTEQTHEKGGFFSGLLKKSNKPAADDVATQGNLSVPSELSASSDSLSENSNKEKGGIFSGMFKKKPAEAAETDQDEESLHGELSGSKDNLNENQPKEKGFFSGMRRKPAKTPGEATPAQEKESLQAEKSASNENLSESSAKEKSGVFSGMFKKSPKPSEGPRLPEGAERLHGELSASTDSLENKEKGGLFSGLLRKTPKTAGEENSSAHKDISGSTDSLSDAANSKERKSQDDEGSTEGLAENKEKGGIFSGIFKKPHKPAEAAQSEEDGESQEELSASKEDLSENTSKEKNIFTNIFKRPQKQAETESDDTENRLSGSSENLTDPTVSKEKKGGLADMFKRSASIEFDLFDEESGGLFSGLRKKTPRASGDEAAAEDKDSQKELSASTENLLESNTTKEKNIFSGMFKKKPADEESGEEKKLSASYENLSEGTAAKEKSGGLAGIFKKSPKPAKRSTTMQDPLSDAKRSASVDSLTEAGEDDPSAQGKLSASNENLESAGTKERKGGFAGMFRRTPKNEEQQADEDVAPPTGGGLRRKRTIKKKRRVVSFRVKKTLPRMPKLNSSSDKMPILEETVELQELNPVQENTVEVELVEMAAYPTPLPAQQENNELMDWWNSVKGWTEWNESSNFGAGDEEMAMEQAADRVYMAARLFVYLFNQKGAALQQRILELLSLADAADHFHKKTTTAAVGGGVASVAGSVTTITGLILAPFTFGASIIVTAVGIGVATAGSIASATANITDAVHSNMDRKKLETMIQEYQDEIKDIRECMEFVQEGMNTLQDWDFEKYSQSAASKAMNHNIKHVMKEGGRAGKALMINTDKLISTVQVLGAAGGVAKAAQAISVTTGVMSALFLALDIFFLAKDSHKLRKGAKTKFASKIRDVCKDLQDGLLELNKVKTQLQKTMDGIEVEEYEEIEEVEVEVEDELESDPKKLAELEQELDLLEEKLDKKIEEEQQKKKEIEMMKAKEKKEKSMKEKEELDEKEDKEEKSDKGGGSSESKSETDEEEKKKTKEEPSKEQVQKGSKKEKETVNWITAGKHESKRKTDSDTVINKTTDGLRQEVSSREESRGNEKSDKAYGEWVKPESESVRRRSSREDEGGVKPEWKSVHAERETESRNTRRHSSRSDREEERGGRHEEHRRSRHTDRDGDRTESWRRRAEEERGVKDWRAETTREGADHGRTESQRGHETSGSRREHSDRERGSSRQDSTRSNRSERGGERRGSRREYETAGGEEEETERRREHGGSHRRGSDRDGEHHHSRRGSRPRSNALLEDGLNI